MSESHSSGNGRLRAAAKAPPVKRFYSAASVAPTAADGNATVLLDGRPVRTPARAPLAAPPPVAEAIAAEWDAQGETIAPMTMPLTRLVNTAIDGVARTAPAVRDDIVGIAGNDLLVYRADGPPGLVERQKALWDPLVADAQARLGVEIIVTTGIMPVEQDVRLGERVRSTLPTAPLRLAAVHQLATLTGSALIALALAEARLAFDEAWRAAHVDEDWNIEEWGEDTEAAERRAARRSDAEAAAFVLRTAPQG